jgi:signal peptidase II
LRQSIEQSTYAPAGPIVGFLPWVLLPAAIIVLDQLVKVMMVIWIGPESGRGHVGLVDDWLSFEYVENRGAAFGILTSATGALAAVSLLIAAGGVFMMWREHRANRLAAFAIALVVGGAIGNVIDRIYRGYVVDFVAVGGFPRFNLADSAISIGVVLLLAAMVRDDREPRTVQNEEGTSRTDE